MKLKIALITIGILLFGSVFAFAEPIQVQINQAVPHGNEKLGVGSSINLKLPGDRSAHSGVFLGKMVNPDGSLSQYMLVDSDKNRVYLVGAKNIDIPKTSMQSVLRQYDQVGGTCTGYAIDHFLQQMSWSGFTGNGNLEKTLSDEKGRSQLLVDAINQYYLNLQHRFSINGILNQYGKQFGFKCVDKTFTDVTTAVNYMETQLKSGLPVMIAFNIGPNMVTSAYSIQDYENPKPLFDARLWVPRKVGERNSGGHTVVAVSEFEVNHRKKLLMLDSDWSYPRIWDVNEYLGSKTAIQEIEFISCK